MTINGLILDGPDRAVVWADSEVYRSSVPHDFRAKLTVNPVAACVGVGTGNESIVAAAAREMAQPTNVDFMLKPIADAMRREANRHVEAWESARPGSFLSQAFAVAGWSEEFDRVLAWEFLAERFFVACLTTTVCLPHVDAFHRDAVHSLHGIARVAAEQMKRVRTGIPTATGGPLTVADVRRGHVQTWRLDDWFSPQPEGKA